MKVLTFTIPKGGVGKTLLQANVAPALALSGKRVVVFDADPSKAMETIMGIEGGATTLSQAISKNLSPNEASAQDRDREFISATLRIES